MKLPSPSRLSQVRRAVALLGFGQADELERQPSVIQRRAPGQQAVLLEYSGDLAAEIIEVGVRTLIADPQ